VELHPAVRAVLAAPLPASFDLHQFEPNVFDQGASGSCTANATSAGVAVGFAAAGKPLAFIPSQRAMYATTRAYERALTTAPGQPLPTLTDSGAELADVYATIARYGVCPMLEATTSDGRFSDVEMSTLNAEPAAQDLMSAANTIVLGPYGVDPTSSNASDVLAAAIVAGIPVGVATWVGQAFMSLGANDVAQPEQDGVGDGGGHALLVTGWRTVNGARQWRVRNSWGASWCDSGYCWASEAWTQACWELHPLAVVLGVS